MSYANKIESMKNPRSGAHTTADFGQVIIVSYLNSQIGNLIIQKIIKVKFTASLYTVSLYDEFKIDPPLSTTLRS